MKYETFEEKFSELTVNERISIYNEYCYEHGDADNAIYSFDEEFFETYLSSRMEAARATFFGDIKSWNDEYIRFNAYGNLESLTQTEALNEIEDYLEEIFDNKDVWEDYFDDEDDEEDEITYVCPHCGHVFEQGEWDFNYDTALLDFKCPECDWEGNENELDIED